MSIGSRKSILVVEDDAATRDAVSLALEDEGYSVTGVANGQEALLHLRQTVPPPNLILLDLRMPVMNGWEFRKQQTQDPALKSIPVVVVSADVSVPQKAAALGATEYLIKPVDFDKLIKAVQRHC
jgi:CheY-like chemotaxis protein